MFTNKYSKLYFNITSNAKQRIIEGYTERHHIIPQSLGGSNNKDNLVELTAREHFICHWLLIKMTEGEERGKMLYALNGMKAENKYQKRYHTKITARVYERYRIEHSENHSKTMKGRSVWNKGRKLEGEELEKHRERIRNRKQMSPETKAKWIADRIATVTGTKRSEETKLKMSLAAKGKSKGPQSEEHKLAISLSGKGIKKKEGHSDNVRNAVKGNISINKDGIEKKVKKDTLQTYLDQGWKLGGKLRKLINTL
jgi:hypothetical protein